MSIRLFPYYLQVIWYVVWHLLKAGYKKDFVGVGKEQKWQKEYIKRIPMLILYLRPLTLSSL